MKKIIQYEALGQLKFKLQNEGLASNIFTIGEMLDNDGATYAQIRRFQKVLDKMLDSALANYPIEDREFAFGS